MTIKQTLSINAPFKINVDSSSSTKVYIRLSGAFRRGQIAVNELQKVDETIRDTLKFADRGIVIFDLSALTYWDTLGINRVVPHAQLINSRARSAKTRSKIGIIGPMQGSVYSAAEMRHRNAFQLGLVPWAATEDELLQKL